MFENASNKRSSFGAMLAAAGMVFFVCLAFTASAAAQVPNSLVQQGRLVADSGEPVEGSVEMTFTIYDSESGGAVLWQQATDVTLDQNGFYSVTLGSDSNPVDTTVLMDGQAWLSISIDGGAELSPRQKLNSVPFAQIAAHAASVSDGAITNASLASGFTIDSSQISEVSFSQLTDVPTGFDDGDSDTLGEMSSCASGDAPVYDGSAWTCQALYTDADAVAAMGTKGASNPLNHDAYTDTDAQNAVSSQDAYVSNAGDTIDGNLDVTGDLSVGGTFQFPLGASRSNPAQNCNQLLTQRPGLSDGIYWLQPSSASAAFQAYCDMTTQNGGWTLVWSNLRGARGKPMTEIQWGMAINTLPRVNGQLTADIESFIVYTGLAHWESLSPDGQFRYDWAPNYGDNIDQRYTCSYNLDENSNYTINFSGCSQQLGNTVPGIVATHNGPPFTTYDRDNDNNTNSGENCSDSYSKSPWWYTACWSGSINGGGEYTSGYTNAAYWVNSAGSWGQSGGQGGGNGWMFVK